MGRISPLLTIRDGDFNHKPRTTREMKSDYWNVTDEQVIEKTGKPIAHWMKALDKFKAAEKKSNDVVAHLVKEHEVPRYWARTLTTRYLKEREAS